VQAPAGERLEAGRTYADVQRWPFQQPGHAGMSIENDHRGCNEVLGRFTVDELERALDGGIARIVVSYTEWCEIWAPPVVGVVRLTLGPLPPPPTPPRACPSPGWPTAACSPGTWRAGDCRVRFPAATCAAW
jgi:hypothetical protein